MSITAFTGWSATAALNVDLNSIPLASASMNANQVDDAFREMMAQLAAGVVAKASGTMTGSVPLSFTGATTGTQYMQGANTGGSFRFGLESSAGSAVAASGLAYATVLNAVTATALQLATNNAARLTIDSAGSVGIGNTAPGMTLDVTGAVRASLPIIAPTYTVATVPSAATYARGLIYVSNETGGAVMAFSDGTSWRRVTDRAVVS